MIVALLIGTPAKAKAEDVVPAAADVSFAPAGFADVPPPRQNSFPRARWEHRRNGELWTRVVLSAVNTHGRVLLDVVPKGIADWCPWMRTMARSWSRVG